MPELPEVETVRLGLLPYLENVRLTSVSLNTPMLRFPFSDGFRQTLTGATITHLTRRAKYLLFHLDREAILLTHLGMSGKFTYSPTQEYRPQKHDHVVFETDTGNTIAYNDPRRFGFMFTMPVADIENHQMLASLGVEPLSDAFSHIYLAEKLHKKSVAIKQALLDQRVVAGLGNIYVSESLHYANINPLQPAQTIPLEQLEKLVESIKMVLKTALAAGGSTLNDYSHPSGELGCFQHQFAVYGRHQQPCKTCHTGTIQKITQGGRSSFYCNFCQKMP
jgi:formamidopyrimidine-DNA glycosylase